MHVAKKMHPKQTDIGNDNGSLSILTSLAISREILAALTETASLGR